MKKKELQDIIRRYDAEKGLGRKLFSTSSDEISRIKVISEQKLLKDFKDDDRLPYSVIYEIHKVITTSKLTTSNRLSNRLLQECKELIKNYVPMAKDQNKEFNKIQADYNLFIDELKSNQEKIEKLEKSIENGEVNAPERIKLEILEMYELWTDENKKRWDFEYAIGGPKCNTIDNVRDRHLISMVSSFYADIVSRVENNYDRAKALEAKLGSAISHEDQLRTENQSLNNQLAATSAQVRIANKALQDLGQAFGKSLSYITSAQVSAQSYCAQQLSDIKDNQSKIAPPEMVAAIDDILKSILEHKYKDSFELNVTEPRTMLDAMGSVLDINFMVEQKNNIEKLIEKYQESNEVEPSAIFALKNVVGFMEHHVKYTRDQFYKNINTALNQEVANVERAKDAVGGVVMASDNITPDGVLFDMSTIADKMNDLNINDQSELDNFTGMISDKIQAVQKRIDSNPPGTLKVLALDTLKALTSMQDTFAIYNTYAKADPKMRGPEKEMPSSSLTKK